LTAESVLRLEHETYRSEGLLIDAQRDGQDGTRPRPRGVQFTREATLPRLPRRDPYGCAGSVRLTDRGVVVDGEARGNVTAHHESSSCRDEVQVATVRGGDGEHSGVRLDRCDRLAKDRLRHFADGHRPGQGGRRRLQSAKAVRG